MLLGLTPAVRGDLPAPQEVTEPAVAEPAESKAKADKDAPKK
jgi:hypothetical protein